MILRVCWKQSPIVHSFLPHRQLANDANFIKGGSELSKGFTSFSLAPFALFTPGLWERCKSHKSLASERTRFVMSPVPIIGHNHRLSANSCLPPGSSNFIFHLQLGFTIAKLAHLAQISARCTLLFEPEETTRTAFTSLMGIYHLNCYRSHCLRGNLEPPRSRCWRTLSRPMDGSLSDEPTASSSC